jgi:hypothetical protein
MRCISLLQPFASLIALNQKRIETRSKDFTGGYKGPLLIHASRGKDYMDLCYQEPFYSALEPHIDKRILLIENALPLGCIVAVCDLVDVVRINDTLMARDTIMRHLGLTFDPVNVPRYKQEYEFGDYTPGRWMLLLRNIVALDKPIPAKGKLGLWNWEAPGDWAGK